MRTFLPALCVRIPSRPPPPHSSRGRQGGGPCLLDFLAGHGCKWNAHELEGHATPDFRLDRIALCVEKGCARCCVIGNSCDWVIMEPRAAAPKGETRAICARNLDPGAAYHDGQAIGGRRGEPRNGLAYGSGAATSRTPASADPADSGCRTFVCDLWLENSPTNGAVKPLFLYPGVGSGGFSVLCSSRWAARKWGRVSGGCDAGHPPKRSSPSGQRAKMPDSRMVIPALTAR